MLTVESDEHFMRMALIEAQRAYDLNEVPVGAVIVSAGRIIARAHNLTEQLNDVTAHAEMLAFTAASEFMGSKYLWDCTLYVTLEPCIMCAGAAFWTQMDRIVFGASDEKRGFRNADSPILHPKTKLEGGLLADESVVMLQDFFRKLRS
ncbi:MAG TPA: tRNA-specific adenosine deaminase [Flavobacteriales bacterium]|jgi:tRNA(adenine34) deaminase|nr:tRNA-specific adenosine deaminase [Flavobacteriales bacterium]